MSNEGRSGLTRRAALGASAAACGFAAARATAKAPENSPAPFRYCLNTATIRGQQLGIEREIEVAAEAGYDGIEPWVSDIAAHRDGGGSIDDLRKKIADAGLTVESAIGFADWITDDDAKREAGLEQARRDMDLLRSVGGTRIAAPPVGGRTSRIDPDAAAERYAAMCDVGRDAGVVPQLEVWGFAATLSTFAEAMYVATAAGRDNAMLLLDAYHLHRGSSGTPGDPLAGLHLLGPRAMEVFHLNDYPADPPAEQLQDRDRVLPGDGAAPLADLFDTFRSIGFAGALSLELFNPGLWERDPLVVAKEGLAKMKAVVEPST